MGSSSLPGLLFEPDCPYTGCRICGDVYQSDLDRLKMPTTDDLAVAVLQRKEWSQRHAKSHSDREHLLLAYSGRWCTPEAAHKLASFGVIALSDMVLSDEHEEALLQSKAVPINDSEGS